MSIYLVMVGEFAGDRLSYTSLVAYKERRLAKAYITQRKKLDAYAAQYDQIYRVKLR